MSAEEVTQSPQSKTPDNITIQPRKFDLKAFEKIPEYYFDNDPFKTHFFNGLSLLFPEGERFFIKSVLAYRDDITDPKLLKEIKEFSAQEAQHTLVHEALNGIAKRHGYPTEKLEGRLRFLLRNFIERGKTSPRTKRAALAMTVALEHFTAIIAYQALTHKKIFKGIEPPVLALFQWHAVEETEHKAVAFDVYQAIGGSYIHLRLRMLIATFFFTVYGLVHTITFLRKDGNIKKWSTWKSAASYLFGREVGFYRIIFKDWLAFFNPKFHPWKQHKNLDLGSTNSIFTQYLKPAATPAPGQ